METQRDKLKAVLQQGKPGSFRAFAARCGITPKHLSEILACKTGLSLDLADVIAREAGQLGAEIEPAMLCRENRQMGRWKADAAPSLAPSGTEGRA